MSRCKYSYMLLVFLSFCPLASSAQEQQPSITPYLTDTAIAFARVRIDRLDLAPVKELSQQYSQVYEAEVKQLDMMVSMVQGLQKQFVDAGVTDLYAVVDLENFFYGPYFLLDYEEGADVAQITAMWKDVVKQINLSAVTEYKELDGFLYAGDEQILANITSGHTAERPQLAAALEAVKADPLQIVICPSSDQRRAIRETVPALPTPFQQVDGEVFSRGIQYVSAGFYLEPDLGLRVVMQSGDEATAEILMKAERQALSIITQLVLTEAPFPGLEMLASKLQIRREKDRLLLDVSLQPEEMKQFNVLMTKPLEGMRAQAKEQNIMNDLKQQMIAMHNWHDTYKVFPAHANYSKDGKPLLSWRVHVLPFLDQQALYQQFHLDEPWDSEHNKKLIAQMPPVLAVDGSKVAKDGKTGYVFPILKDGSGITNGTKAGIQFQEITDGTSNTAMIVTVDDEHSVIWTKPDDLVVDPKKPLAGLRFDANGLFQVGFADGSARRILNTVDPKVWLAVLTRAGREVVELP